ncbi:MAG: diadenylate cyclase [Mycobacteriales bacterium]
MEAIRQFMWGFQPHFRMSLEHAAERALERIGTELRPTALLIGFRAADATDGLPICVEPETGPAQPEHLAGVEVEGRSRYESSDDANRFHTDPGLHRSTQAGYRDRHRSDALAEALPRAPGGGGRRFFVGRSVRVGQHDVHPVIAVDAAALDALPSLRTAEHTNMHMTVSLPIGVIEHLLRVATRSMLLREPPQSLLSLSEDASGDAIREAAQHLLYSVATMSGNFLAHGLYPALQELVNMPYEGRAGSGAFILAKATHPSINVSINLAEPVAIGAGQQLRKLLEMTTPTLNLLCDGDQVYGLGQLDPAYDPGLEDAFTLAVAGRGTWDLSHGPTTLMRVAYGVPQLPRARMSKELFADTVTRVFGDVEQDDIDRLWQVAEVAADAAHGTMLVISGAAEAETVRLAPQALAIEPQLVAPETLRSLTRIDGALLLGPDATCYAVGVILDGYAAGVGDPGRGARYNSAVRYLQTTQVPCVIVIVSEDGMIDIHPELAPRVARADVEAAVRALEQAALEEPVNFERVYKSRREVERVSFYLSAEQAARANEATDRVEEERHLKSQMRIYLSPFRADERMNDSFFLDR